MAWAGEHFSTVAEAAKDVFHKALLGFGYLRQSGQLDSFSGNIKAYLFAIRENLLLSGLRRLRIAGSQSNSLAIQV